MKRKMKSLSSLKKRIKRTATGQYKRSRGGTSHNNTCKSKARKRRLHRSTTATGAQARSVRQLIPYA